jgi:hypothetical protein
MQKSDEVKITAFVPRELWARTRAEAVRSDKSAREIIAMALEAYLRQSEQKSKGGPKR